MDPLTHTLTGAALSRAGYHRVTPLATATLVLAANAPDIDILAGFGGAYATVAFRRGWTHGPLALLLLPILLTGLILAYDRWIRRRRDPDAPPANGPAILLLALLGTATHPLLDWMNTYGIRLLMPFSGEWFYGDALFIVDPWLWLVLGGAVYLAGVLRRGGGWAGSGGGRGAGARARGVGTGEGAREGDEAGTRAGTERGGGDHAGAAGVRSGWRTRMFLGDVAWATLALLASLLVLGTSMVPTAAKVVWVVGLTALVVMRLAAGRVTRAPRVAERIARWGVGFGVVYITLMVLASAAAEREVRRTLVAIGFGPEQVMVAPEPANPFRSSVLATSSTSYIRGSYHWLQRPRVRLDAEPIPFPPRNELTEAAAETRAARRFLTWSRFPILLVQELEDGYLVQIRDLRFMGTREGELNGVRVRLDREGRVVR